MIVDGLEYLTDRLTAAGVTAVVDLADLDPPCVLIGWPQLTFDRLDVAGSQTAEYPLFLVVGNTGRRSAADAVGALLRSVSSVLTPHGTVEPVDLADPQGGDALPAYRFPVLLELTDD